MEKQYTRAILTEEGLYEDTKEDALKRESG